MAPNESIKTSTFLIKENIIHLCIAVLFTLTLFSIYYFLSVGVLEFEQFNGDYGADLPFLTEFLYKNYMWYPVFYVLATLSFVVYFIKVYTDGSRKKAFWRTVKINSIFCAVVFVCVIVVLYLPMFLLEDVMS